MPRLIDALAVCGLRLAAVAAAPALAVLRERPRRRPAPQVGRVESVFRGPSALRRWQVRLTPEAEAMRLGAWLATRCDFRVPTAAGVRIRRVVGELLGEVADRPEYRTLTPALPLAVWGSPGRPDHGHHFAYVPPHAPGDRLGLLIALHGHGGNAVLWLHAWRPFADAERFVVVCPSFGYGNWEHPASAAAVGRCLSYAVESYPVDPGRVCLAGLSQGGAGVGRAGAAMPDRFAGLIFLSPTMEPAVLGSPAFVAGWKGRPVLVVHGGRDRHVPPAGVDAAVAGLERDGVAVTVHRHPDADHGLFVDRRADIFRRIAAWGHGPAGRPATVRTRPPR